MHCITIIPILLVVITPAMAQAIYWEPGAGASPEIYQYVICDTQRQVCYDAAMEFLVPVLHGQKPYWIVQADMTIIAGSPPGMIYPAGYVAEPWRITGEPIQDIELLDDSLPPGIPTSTYTLLYDGVTHSPFIDHSRILVDSLGDTVFGMNELVGGGGLVRLGERWGESIVYGSADGLYVVRYVGAGSASFLIDPAKPMPVAGIYSADRYDPYVSASMWFYAERHHMDILLGIYDEGTVDVSGPDDAMRAGTLEGLSWTSETYQVQSLTTTPDTATIRGTASGNGTIHVVMPAFGGSYTFWQDGSQIPANYTVAGGVLSALMYHDTGHITIHAIPNDICVGDCLGGVIVRAWHGPSALVYGGGYNGAVRLSMVPGDPNGVAASICPPGSEVTINFDVIPSRHDTPTLPYVTTYESALDISMSREGQIIWLDASGEPAAITLRMPAMVGDITYEADGVPLTPLAESIWYDTVTATIQHMGGNVTYVVHSDGPTAWKSGLAISPPAERTGVVWCGMSEPVNAAVIRDAGINRQDCGVTRFSGGWNVWC